MEVVACKKEDRKHKVQERSTQGGAAGVCPDCDEERGEERKCDENR
jgi:hypothetical protein